ncbi:MAG: GC-type dockerin domain-anchored protein, partial [Planctomycetota bacterium]
IIGDFNGDGSFDVIDARYFVDGLALDTSTGNLDRAAAFLAADNASFDGNAFNTALLGGAPYVAGASAADVAGAAGTTPGYHPIGADGVVDGQDIDYIFLQYSDLGDAELDWSDTAEASQPRRDGARRDLSADVTGDLLVNVEDVCATLDFLGLDFGDLNRDGSVDGADSAIISANLGLPGGYFDGDLNGDGQVDAADQSLAGTDPCDGGTGGRLCADQNADGVVNPADFNVWVLNFNANSLLADVNQNGLVEPGDFNAWVSAFNLGANGPTCNP